MSTPDGKPPTAVDKQLAELGIMTLHDGRLEARTNKLKEAFLQISKPLNIEMFRVRWLKKLKQDKSPTIGRKKRGPGRPRTRPLKDGEQPDGKQPLETLTPMGVVLRIESRTYQMDQLLREVSIPWGRAADTAWYADAIRAWERLLAKGAFGMIDGVKNILMNKNTMVEWDLVKRLEGFLQVEIYSYAKMIMDVSWRAEDVSPSFSLTLNRPPTPIQQFDSPQSRGQFAASMERESDMSQNYNYPGTMQTRVKRKDGQG